MWSHHLLIPDVVVLVITPSTSLLSLVSLDLTSLSNISLSRMHAAFLCSGERVRNIIMQIYISTFMTKYSGRGRFSVVHFATRKRDMMPCALKKINCNPSDLPGGVGGGGGGVKESVSPEKCLKEVGLLRSLDHPNIIKYLDSFLHESELYIILEWAGKGDLKELISEQRKIGFHFSEGAVWTLFSQVTISSPPVCLSVLLK
jgi:hypothetical protein